MKTILTLSKCIALAGLLSCLSFGPFLISAQAVTLNPSTTARIDISAASNDGIEVFFSSAGDPLDVGEAFQFSWYNGTSGNLINAIVGPYNSSGSPIPNPTYYVVGSIAGDPSILFVTMLTGSFSFNS